jgi:hypothetical protein
MQLLDYLQLKGQTLNGFAAEVRARLGEQFGDERSLEAARSRVWRHAHGKRTPKPIEIALYDELTKGAVTAADWIELALRAKALPAQDATEPAAATG